MTPTIVSIPGSAEDTYLNANRDVVFMTDVRTVSWYWHRGYQGDFDQCCICAHFS
jgi:hypothetical protein